MATAGHACRGVGGSAAGGAGIGDRPASQPGTDRRVQRVAVDADQYSGRRTRPVSGSGRTPSAVSTSAAHSPIAASDLALARTAQIATDSRLASRRRTPRRSRGSGTVAR
jgi:hypothetical protein